MKLPVMAAVVAIVALSMFLPSVMSAIGAKFRLTRNGLNYVGQSIGKALGNMEVTPIFGDGNSGGNKFQIRNLVLRYGEVIKTSLIIDETKRAFKLTLTNATASACAQYAIGSVYKQFSDRGLIDVTLTGINFEVFIYLFVSDIFDEPRLASGKCKYSLTTITPKVKGKVTGQALTDISQKVAGNLAGGACENLKKFIDDKGNFEISRLALQTKSGLSGIQYRLIGKPVITRNYVESYHTGTVFYSGLPSKQWYQVKPFPYDDSTSKMAYVWISEAIIFHLAGNAYQSGALTHTFNEAEVVKIMNKMQVQCTNAWQCLFMSIAGLKKPTTNLPKVSVSAKISKNPIVTVDKNGIKIVADGEIRINEEGIYWGAAVQRSLATVQTKVYVNAQAEFKGGAIYGNVTTMALEVYMNGTRAAYYEWMESRAVQAYGLKVAKDYFSKSSFYLPLAGTTKAVNYKVTYKQGSILVDTDFAFM